MGMIAFDTLKFTRKLESVGVARDHAIGIAEALADVQQESVQNLATKDDIAAVRVEIQQVRTELLGEIQQVRTELLGEIQQVRTELLGEIQQLRTEVFGEIAKLRSEMKEMELRMTIKLGMMQLGSVGLLLAALKYLN
jgi:hypothetical protein